VHWRVHFYFQCNSLERSSGTRHAESAEGNAQWFGLVNVDFCDSRRMIKDSGHWLQQTRRLWQSHIN
jgi:hypothetical protein